MLDILKLYTKDIFELRFELRINYADTNQRRDEHCRYQTGDL